MSVSVSEYIYVCYGDQLIVIKVMLPPRLINQIGRILLYCTESIGSLYQAKVRLPLGGVEDNVPSGRGHELPLLGYDGQVVSHQAYEENQCVYIRITMTASGDERAD